MLRARYLFLVVPVLLFWCIASNWWLLDVTGIGTTENFIDLNWFYSYVGCIDNFSDIVLPSPINCSTLYNHGPGTSILFWLILNSGVSVYMLGTFMIIAITAALVLMSLKLGQDTLLARVYQILLLLCPGMLLLFERGNVDGLIFLGLTVIIFGLYEKYPSISLFLLFLLSLVKFYTIFSVIFLILLGKLSIKKKILEIIFSLTIVLFFAVTIVDKIPYNWFLSFGSFMPLAYIDFTLKEFGLMPKIIESLTSHIEVRVFLGAIISFLIILFFYKFLKHYRILLKEMYHISTNSQLISSSDIYFYCVSIIFITCYFFSTNYDYRMVFLVPSLILLDKKVSGKISQYFLLISLAISTLLLGSIYSSPKYFLQGIQFFGDISANLLVGVLLAYIVGCPNFSAPIYLKKILQKL